MKKFIVLVNLVFINTFLFSQECGFSGVIQDQKGTPIPYGSIYIAKIGTGNIANAEGKFQLRIPCGSYQIKLQCLGYETKTINIDASVNKENQIIVLQPKSFQIREVTINAKEEDPAYNIMRKAIVMAEYYKKQIKDYSCNVYVKSFYMVDKVPGLMKLFTEDEELDDIKTGNISETLLSYSYEYPDKVRQKILFAKNGSGDTARTGSQYISLNFYGLGGGDIISPISKNAFQVYKFELESSYLEDGNTINKIKIIPRRKGNDLMSGFIYINDDSWSINSVNVAFKQQMVDITYKQLYTEISKNVWFPISHDIGVEGSLLGFKGHFKQLASISKIKIKTDPIIDEKINSIVEMPIRGDRPKEDLLLETKTEEPKKEAETTEEKINELMTKDKLTKRETFKLVRLVKKQGREEEQKNLQEEESRKEKGLEVKRDYKIEYADSAFTKSDAEWEEIREVPLSEEEKVIYESRDSLTKVQKGDTVINQKRSVIGTALFYNGTIKAKNKKSKLRIYGGLLAGVDIPQFNTVDGLILKKKLLFYKYDFEKGKYLSVLPAVKYAFSRDDVMGDMVFKSQYNAKKRAGFNFLIGKSNADFNSGRPMPEFFNSVSSLFFEENYKKLYQKRYAKLEHQTDIKNGLVLNTSLEYADRRRLSNHSDFKIVDVSNRNYSSNIPFMRDSSDNLRGFQDDKAFNLFAKLSYTPKHYYRFVDEQKEMLYSKYPTFDLTYKQGINGVFDSETDYSFVEFAFHQSRKLGLINKVNYYVGAGTFLSSKSVNTPDYKGFNTQPFYFIGESDINSFKLLDFYSYSTKDYFFEGHLSIEDNVLLLKRLPFLNGTNLTEELYVNYLYTDLKDHYYELGYSLNKLFFLFDVEAFVSFENSQYQAFGIKLKFNFLENFSTAD